MAAQGSRYFSVGLAGLVVNMGYLTLLVVALITALVWIYFAWFYPVSTEKEVLNFDLERSYRKATIAAEAKRFCYLVFACCALAAALLGAAEW